MPRCGFCKRDKPASAFSKRTQYRRRAQCDSCLALTPDERLRRSRKNSDLKRWYGITLNEFEDMVAAAKGKCMICRQPPSRKGFALAVDHDKETGIVRGVLCDSCNQGIGRFHHDIRLLRAAARYLARNPGTG